MDSITVIITDDHPILRVGLVNVLARSERIRVIGEAANSEELFELLDRMTPDIILLDLLIPGITGFDVLKKVRQLHPNIAVLILSMQTEESHVVRSLRLGAAGYFYKGNDPADLEKAITTIVVDRKRYLSDAAMEHFSSYLNNPARSRERDSLSGREMQVLRFLALGKTMHTISEKLSISIGTVSTYRSRIMSKLSLKTNVELTHYVVNHHLLDQPKKS